MATRKPLVVISGVVQELPSGDSVDAGSSFSTGTAEIDFSTGSNEANVTITGQTGIGTGSTVWALIEPAATSNHTVNDHKYAATLMGITCSTIVAGTGFTIHARSIHKHTGIFNVRWNWS